MDEKNNLYFGDNLKILREYVTDASVDLIYLDPPFNSSATYNVLFKEKGGEAHVDVTPTSLRDENDSHSVLKIPESERRSADL